MRIRIENISEDGSPISEKVGLAEVELGDPCYTLGEPLAFTGRAIRSGEEIYVDGKLTGRLTAQCGLCLEEFIMPFDVEVDVVFVPEREDDEDDEEICEDEGNISYYDGESIDLLQEIKAALLISLPLKPICRPDCKGLCPHCGTDLNRSSCKCKESSDPSPFEKLKELKTRLQ